MSLLEKLIAQISAWIAVIVKQITHWITGESELERICLHLDNGRHTTNMTIHFTNAIRKSKQLKSVKTKFFQPKPFSIQSAQRDILELKRIRNPKPLLLANISNCLQALRLVNVLQAHILTLRGEAFSYENSRHVQLLELLWIQLKPGVARSSARLSEEWGSLGFQGKDPATDFRGMGMFGLTQLLYFSKYFSVEAQEILKHTQDDAHFCPFAVAGINITAFICELLDSSHCHRYLFQYLDIIILQDSIGSHEGYSEDIHCIELALKYLHDLYCQIFIAFGELWRMKQPKNVMEFPVIFQELKETMRNKFPPLQPLR
jgi:hypothetical protein